MFATGMPIASDIRFWMIFDLIRPLMVRVTAAGVFLAFRAMSACKTLALSNFILISIGFMVALVFR